MQRETPYGGSRFRLNWSFYSKPRSQPLNIDVCAGDSVKPSQVQSEEFFLFRLGEKSISFQVYPPEYIFAEKLHTVFHFQTGNTRVKDFIDLWVLIHCELNKELLKGAIQECFRVRDTAYDTLLLNEILTDSAFVEDLEQRRKRHFSKLETPMIQKMNQEILEFLNGLGV